MSLTIINQKESTIDEVPMVGDFSDVFSKDLPRMPLDGEVEFTIDLVQGATPIAKASYHIVLVKLQDLKV